MMIRLFLVILIAKMFCLAHGAVSEKEIQDALMRLEHHPVYSGKRNTAGGDAGTDDNGDQGS